MKTQPVLITGMGAITAHGVGISCFHDALYHGKYRFSKREIPPLSFPVLGSFIDDFVFADSLGGLADEQKNELIKMSRRLPTPIQLSITASLEAYLQAKMDEAPVGDSTRLGVIVTGQNSSGRYEYDLQNDFKKDPEYLSPSFALNFLDTNYIGVLSEVIGAKGEGFTVGGSLASGNIALLKAHQLIQSGLQDVVLVVGAIADLSPMEFQGFRNIGALGGESFIDSPERACRPFDSNHEGFIYGQGVGAIVLESASSAEKRGVSQVGRLLGGSITLDGNRLSNPCPDGELRSMKMALENANCALDDVDYINSHGTSAPLGDKTEIEAIETLLGKRSNEVPINSTKSITGHCLWAAGIIETIATIIQIQGEFVHPTLNLEDPISSKSRFITQKSLSCPINIALKNGFGFGGFNSSIILSK